MDNLQGLIFHVHILLRDPSFQLLCSAYVEALVEFLAQCLGCAGGSF